MADHKTAEKTKEEMDAATQAAAQAETNKQDETVPGGEYIVNGVKVNSEGEEIGKHKKTELAVKDEGKDAKK